MTDYYEETKSHVTAHYITLTQLMLLSKAPYDNYTQPLGYNPKIQESCKYTKLNQYAELLQVLQLIAAWHHSYHKIPQKGIDIQFALL